MYLWLLLIVLGILVGMFLSGPLGLVLAVTGVALLVVSIVSRTDV